MRLWALTLSALAASFSAIASTGAAAKAGYEVEITRTTYGIPHISSDTWQGVGYGVAYAYAQDNFCMLAEEFATIAGERSLHFGPENSSVMGFREVDNVTSDFFYRSQLDLAKLQAVAAREQSLETQQLISGYVAGYNRYLSDTGVDNLPEACRGKDWVRPISVDDMLRMNGKQMLLASSLALAPGMATAAPPDAPTAAHTPRVPSGFPKRGEPTFGSNGWAFGGDATADGKGLLIGNPHFPWEGPARFWQMHVRGPDGFDVMGVGLAATPIPTLGFNKDIAWTHTVTAARHFAAYALKLSPEDPTTYMLDGEPVKMESSEVSVPMPDGAPPLTRTFYSTKFGPIVTVPGTPFGWTKAMAFALRDANSDNGRALEAWLGIGRASNVEEVQTAISETLGIPWVNTIVADRDGNALHADITAVPNVTKALIEACSTPFTALVAAQLTLLDGSRSECDTLTNETAAGFAGLLPAAEQASRTRRDYVTNSNDSYWISNASSRYQELSPILGPHSNQLTLRTRSNFAETEAMLSAGKMDHEQAKALTFGNKSLAADLTVEPLLTYCAKETPAAEACTVLLNWDRRFNADSRGAHLFLRFWEKVEDRKDLWTVPFDPSNPLTTPGKLTDNAEILEELRVELVEAAYELEQAGSALDAAWGDVQIRASGEERIAVHGGPGNAGILNMQRSRVIEGGLTPVHGSSYIQIVGFDEAGPVADAILSYSQSTDPASPHYADQTRNYATKTWYRLPFSDEQIKAEQIGETLILSP
ncbi:MAG: penicillin acylase family protein [Pseudomonadota bacterium]